MVLDISSGTSTTRRLMGELVGVPITTPNSIGLSVCLAAVVHVHAAQ